MFGFDSAMDLGDRDHIFDDGWFDVVRFLAYSTSDSILGHISVSIEIYRFSWSCMIIPTYEIHAEMMTYLLSYHDPLMEPLWSNLVRLPFFGIWMSSYFPFWGMPFWSTSLIQLWMWMTRIAHSMMDDLISFDFLTYYTSDVILGHISYLVEICRSSLICMIISNCEMYAGMMTWSHFVMIIW